MRSDRSFTALLPVEAFLKHRRRALIIFVLIVLASIALMPLVHVNYDMRKYLPKDSETSRSLELLEATFGTAGSAYAMVPAASLAEALRSKQAISGVSGVSQVLFADDLMDLKQADNWLDQDSLKLFYNEGQALFTISFMEDDYSKQTSQALTDIRSQLEAIAQLEGQDPEAVALAGPAVRSANMSSSVGREMFWIMAVVIPLFLIILLLFTHSYTEAVLFLLVIGAAVVINIGTNSIFPHISFMTHLSVAVLQLAISMDYSIFLLHRFGQERESEPDLTKAMIKAVRASFAPITASALTTMAGFLALTGMRYSLGRDMGLVLSKGIFLSLVSVLLMLPVLTITFIRSIDKTSHRILMPGFKRSGKATIKARFVTLPVWIVLMMLAFLAQSNNSFIYGETAIMASKGSRVELDQARIEQEFGRQNPLLILLPSGSPAVEYQLAAELGQIEEVTSLQALAVLADPALPRELLPPAAIFQLERNGYARMILTLDLEEEGERAFALTERIRGIAVSHSPEAVVFGPTTSVADIKNVVEHDYTLVNWLSILAVGLILLITFRSLILPILLILVIESAIWLNMAVPYIEGKPLSFIGYMIISAVQLGATIDYAILLTSRYQELRLRGDKLSSGQGSIEMAGSSILMSAGILTLAGFAVWIVSSLEGIRELGLLIGRGALLSGIMVLFILPQLLSLLDRVIQAADLRQIFRRLRGCHTKQTKGE